jgi:hypothetical protein
MHVPRFDPSEEDHKRLSDISLEAHKERRDTQSSKTLSEDLETELTSLVRSIATSGAKKTKAR